LVSVSEPYPLLAVRDTVYLPSPVYVWLGAPKQPTDAAPVLYPRVAIQAVRTLDPPPRAVLTDNAWGLYYTARVPCAQFPTDGAEAALRIADALSAAYLVTTADAPDRIPAMAEIIDPPRFKPHARYPTDGPALLVYRILPPSASPQPPSDRRLRMSQ